MPGFVLGSLASHDATCRRLLGSVVQRGLPTLVIEPAKDEYVQWALEQNRGVAPENHIAVFMPGVEKVGGEYYNVEFDKYPDMKDPGK